MSVRTLEEVVRDLNEAQHLRNNLEDEIVELTLQEMGTGHLSHEADKLVLRIRDLRVELAVLKDHRDGNTFYGEFRTEAAARAARPE